MVRERTFLIKKDTAKGSQASNYRPIACLPMMWKLLTGVMGEKLHHHLERNGLLTVEQKRCRKGSRGTKDQLFLDKAILKNCRRRLTNLSMPWIDYKKAYDMVPHSWILKCLEYDLYNQQQHTPYSKKAADLCRYKLALVASFKIKYSFEF